MAEEKEYGGAMVKKVLSKVMAESMEEEQTCAGGEGQPKVRQAIRMEISYKRYDNSATSYVEKEKELTDRVKSRNRFFPKYLNRPTHQAAGPSRCCVAIHQSFSFHSITFLARKYYGGPTARELQPAVLFTLASSHRHTRVQQQQQQP